MLELITQDLSHISWGPAVNTNIGDGLCVGGVGGGSAMLYDVPVGNYKSEN